MRPRSRLKHFALLGSWVIILVGGMLYSISPGEVEMVWSVARARLTAEAARVFASTAHGGEKTLDSVLPAPASDQAAPGAAPPVAKEPFMPDPFRPYRRGTARSTIWRKGLKPRRAWGVGVMLTSLAFLRRQSGRKRARRALEQKIAASLSKTVRTTPGFHFRS